MTRLGFSTLGVVLLATACSQILGIEDAQVDPALEPGHAGASAAGSGSGTLAQTLPSAGSDAGGTADAPTHEHGNSGTGGKPGGSSSGEPEGGAGGSPAEIDSCAQYCDQITHVCKGKYEQYRTFDQCIQVCKRLPPGEPGDQDVNTVSCRMRQAELADSEPFVYCKSAGPLGGGKCGSNCVSYCSLMQAECTPESTAQNLEPSYYPSPEACLAACGALPADPDGPTAYSSSTSAEPTSFVGNNVFCRTYHVAAALEQDTPDEHCPHAMGGDPCIAQ